jgi:hypothetical protein
MTEMTTDDRRLVNADAILSTTNLQEEQLREYLGRL